MQGRRQEIGQKILHLFLHKEGSPLGKGTPQALALPFTGLFLERRHRDLSPDLWLLRFLCRRGASNAVQKHHPETTGVGAEWGMQSPGIEKQIEHEMTPWGPAATRGEGYNLTFLGNWCSHFPVDLGLWTDSLLVVFSSPW